VRIAGVGLCHTDLVFRDQFDAFAKPAVLGHEGAGVIEAWARASMAWPWATAWCLAFRAAAPAPAAPRTCPAIACNSCR
jgi:aryl-alcohol dehydrogenase